MTESAGATISSNSLVGKIIFGRYLLERKVGQGGMAWVFRAQDLEREVTVAAKILLPHIAENPELRERFLREARIQSQLAHEHIVQFYDANEEEGISAIILEWIEGETLLDVSKRIERPLPSQELYGLFAPILDALQFAHDRQMVHRDIKLENIMLHWDGETPIPKLADFGLAKLLDQMEDNQTKTGMIMGTLKYMAPEQVNATKTVDQRADIYSVGICMYVLATLDTPFTGSMQETIVQILYEGVPDPRIKHTRMSDVLADVILQGVARSPNSRFQTCQAFKAALASAVQTEQQQDLGETLPEYTVPGSVFRALTPPPARRHEPLPSGVNLGEAFANEELSRPFPSSRGRDRSTMITGTSAGRLWWVLGGLAILLLLGAGGFWAWGPLLGSSAAPDAGSPPARPRGCVEGVSRPCFASSEGVPGPAKARGVGLCKEGLQACKGGVFGRCQDAILPAKERCNDKDDNCDGQVDEDFPNKGKECAQQRGECRSVGTWKCDAQGTLTCQLNPLQGKGQLRHISLSMHPSSVAFRLSTRGKQTTITGQHCLAIKQNRSRSVTFRASGFYTCRVRLRTRKPTLHIRMRRRTRRSLEPRRNYCLR